MDTPNLKDFYLRLKDRYPFLADMAIRGYRGGLVRTVTSKIRGTGHALSIHRSAVLKNVRFHFEGKSHAIAIGPDCVLRNVEFSVKGSSHRIVLMDGVRFNRGGSLWIEDTTGEIHIGAGTTFEDTHLAVTGRNRKICVGKDCMFATDIDVRTGDSHAIVNLCGEKQNCEKDVLIGDHVWIAAHCSILKGSTILKESIVGTRSTVTKSFDKCNVVIGGSPARILKEGVSWTRKRFPAGL